MSSESDMLPTTDILRRKVILVTGASGGIGEESARTFSKLGARTVLVARDIDKINSIVKELEHAGYDASGFAVDVTDYHSIEAVVKMTTETYGRLDGAFNNAGSWHLPGKLANLGLENFATALSVNLFGTFYSMKAEIPALLGSGGGSIVNMSSTAGIQGVRGMSAYAAAKQGVIGLTKSAALDYSRESIRINAIAPGPISTYRLSDPVIVEQMRQAVPMYRTGKPSEVAMAAAFLLSDMSSFVTGETLIVDGGRMAGLWYPLNDERR